METIVKIEWDQPEEQQWLCAENIALALHAYCKNTKFKAKEVERELSASEGIFAFCAWLTTREKVTKMGWKNDCAVVADLIQEFCDANKLEDPIDGWTDLFEMPK